MAGAADSGDRAELIARLTGMQRAIAEAIGPHRLPAIMDVNLTMRQLRVVATLSIDGPATSQDLAHTLGVSPGTVTGIVDRLAIQGLVVRTEDPEDRRVRRVALSAAGTDLVERIMDSGERLWRDLMERLDTDTLREYERVLRKIQSAAQGEGGRGLSFGAAADQYDRLRPGYPAEALRWALGDQPVRVVDLGAGTGILSRAVAALGHEVIPVEPDDAMRDRLAAASPGLTALKGYAERIPLPDSSVDAVVAGQAYHWFDPEPAHAEVARVLRPGGVFAPMWNRRDESVPWVAELSVITEDDTAGRGGPKPGSRPAPLGPAFGPVETAAFTFTTTHTPDTLVGLIATRSYYLTASPTRQRELERRVRALCARHPDLAGRSTFALPYRTDVYRARRLT